MADFVRQVIEVTVYDPVFPPLVGVGRWEECGLLDQICPGYRRLLQEAGGQAVEEKVTRKMMCKGSVVYALLIVPDLGIRCSLGPYKISDCFFSSCFKKNLM